MNKAIRKNGYTALMATLIISFILSAAVLSMSSENFWGRQSVLGRELKEISFNLAEGCLQKAILIIVQSPGFEINPHNEILFSDSLVEESDEENLFCVFKSLERDGEEVLIKIQAKAGKAFTNLEARFDEDEMKIISVKEIALIE